MTKRDEGQSSPHHRAARRYGPPVAVAVFVGGAFALGLSSMGERQHVGDDEWATTLLDFPAFAAAPPVSARSAPLQPGALVIGVSIGGHHRAYAIDAMSQSHSHVINDLLGSTPLTVAYCDRTHCARAFTAPGRDGPLDLAVGGWLNADGVRDMLLRAGPHRYLLKTGQALDEASPAFPYEGVEVEMSTWRQWRAEHPDTDVYLGGGGKL